MVYLLNNSSSGNDQGAVAILLKAEEQLAAQENEAKLKLLALY